MSRLETKRCPGWNREPHDVPDTEFYRNRSKPDGLSDWCRECNRAYRRAHRPRPEVKARERADVKARRDVPPPNLTTRDHERDRRILVAYRAGASLRELGERFGISSERVRQILERCGEPRRPPGRPRIVDDQRMVLLVAACRAGASMRELGELFGVSSHTVRRILRQRDEAIAYNRDGRLPGGARGK